MNLFSNILVIKNHENKSLENNVYPSDVIVILKNSMKRRIKMEKLPN